jgi:threonine synthase
LQDGIAGFKANDEATREAMKRIHDQFGYLACPHTAIGIAAAQQRLALGGPVVALATAHPAKFGSVVEDATGIAPEIPESLKGCVEKEKVSVLVEPTLEALRAYLLDTAQA